MKSIGYLMIITSILLISIIKTKKIDENSLASSAINEYFDKEENNLKYIKEIPKRYSRIQNIDEQKLIFDQIKNSNVYEINPGEYNGNNLIINPIGQNDYILSKQQFLNSDQNSFNYNNQIMYGNMINNQPLQAPINTLNNIPNNNFYNPNYLSYQFPNNSTINFNNTNQLGGKISKNALDSLNSVFNKVDYAISQIQEAKFLAEENLKKYEKIEKDHERKISKLEEKIAKKEDQLLTLSSALKSNKDKKTNEVKKGKQKLTTISGENKEINKEEELEDSKKKNPTNKKEKEVNKSENVKNQDKIDKVDEFPFLNCIKKLITEDYELNNLNKCRNQEEKVENINSIVLKSDLRIGENELLNHYQSKNKYSDIILKGNNEEKSTKKVLELKESYIVSEFNISDRETFMKFAENEVISNKNCLIKHSLINEGLKDVLVSKMCLAYNFFTILSLYKQNKINSSTFKKIKFLNEKNESTFLFYYLNFLYFKTTKSKTIPFFYDIKNLETLIGSSVEAKMSLLIDFYKVEYEFIKKVHKSNITSRESPLYGMFKSNGKNNNIHFSFQDYLYFRIYTKHYSYKANNTVYIFAPLLNKLIFRKFQQKKLSLSVNSNTRFIISKINKDSKNEDDEVVLYLKSKGNILKNDKILVTHDISYNFFDSFLFFGVITESSALKILSSGLLTFKNTYLSKYALIVKSTSNSMEYTPLYKRNSINSFNEYPLIDLVAYLNSEFLFLFSEKNELVKNDQIQKDTLNYIQESEESNIDLHSILNEGNETRSLSNSNSALFSNYNSVNSKYVLLKLNFTGKLNTLLSVLRKKGIYKDNNCKESKIYKEMTASTSFKDLDYKESICLGNELAAWYDLSVLLETQLKSYKNHLNHDYMVSKKITNNNLTVENYITRNNALIMILEKRILIAYYNLCLKMSKYLDVWTITSDDIKDDLVKVYFETYLKSIQKLLSDGDEKKTLFNGVKISQTKDLLNVWQVPDKLLK